MPIVLRAAVVGATGSGVRKYRRAARVLLIPVSVTCCGSVDVCASVI